MTSRPIPGLQQQSSQSLGAVRRPTGTLPNRRPSAPSAAVQASRTPSTIDLTDDGDKLAQDVVGKNSQPSVVGGESACKPPLEERRSSQLVGDAGSVRGKPPIYFTAGFGSQNHTDSLSTASAGAKDQRSGIDIPNPPRAGCHVREALQRATKFIIRDKEAKEYPPNTTAFDAPSCAPRYGGGKVADFAPWAGNHPEDVLSEHTVKSGFIVDKSHVQQEGNTARPALWAHLKTKSGLGTLSTLFISALEKRQTAGRLTAPSTFKPPPRIALPESRRENWLNELADPGVPLRKLSRSIPHGIKGKLLLEQCLAKSIPTARAVWLAKCVGTQEIRSFKRKGATGAVNTGEAKWVRDWTMCVAQFLEDVIAICGQPQWKTKMEYSVRLSCHLYSEHLVDRDAYFDWLLASAEGSSMETLPMWLLLVRIYWKDLVASRRRSKRLSRCLLLQMTAITNDDNVQSYGSLATHVTEQLRSLIVSHRSSMVVPESWDRFTPVIEKIQDSVRDSGFDAIIEQLAIRNERLSNASRAFANTASFAKKDIVDALDSFTTSTDFKLLSRRCLQLLPDMTELVSLLLRWAASVHREGSHRMFLAVRLLRKWKSAGQETDSAIMAFLSKLPTLNNIDRRIVYKTVSELIHSSHFAVGKYLQWLIATGTLATDAGIASKTTCHRELLLHMPTYALSGPIASLKDTLLHVSSDDAARATSTLEEVQTYLSQCLAGDHCSAALPDHIRNVLQSLCHENSCCATELTRWLRDEAYATFCCEDEESASVMEDSKAGPPLLSASLAQLEFVREVIETLGDIPILADVLGYTAQSSDLTVLAAVADTLNYHQVTFAAIGALRPLFDALVERYTALRPITMPERTFLLAFTDLCNQLQSDQSIVQQLQYDLGRCEPKNGIAVCSPASDNLMDDLQNASVDTDADIERILTSGTSMDPQIVSRVFKRISSRLVDLARTMQSSKVDVGGWLVRLRSFDEKMFDMLLDQWLHAVLFGPQPELLRRILPTIIGSGSMTLNHYLDKAMGSFASSKVQDSRSAALAASELLGCVLPSVGLETSCPISVCPDLPITRQSLTTTQTSYRYRIEQSKVIVSDQSVVPKLMSTALSLCLKMAETFGKCDALAVFHSNNLLSALRYACVNNYDLVAKSFGAIGAYAEPKALYLPKRIAEHLFWPRRTDESTPHIVESPGGDEAVVSIETTVSNADELSLPFARLKLQVLLQSESPAAEEGETTLSDTLLDCIKATIDWDRTVWYDLLQGLDESLVDKVGSTIKPISAALLTNSKQLRKHAESRLFTMIMSLNQATFQKASQQQREKVLQRYLRVATQLASTTSGDAMQEANALLGRLKTVTEYLNSKVLTPAMPSDPDETLSPIPSNLICSHLSAVLELAVAHHEAFRATIKSSASPVTCFVWSLRTLLANPELSRYPALAEYIYDVVSLFVDDLPDDIRCHISKIHSTKAVENPSPYLLSLFDCPPQPDAWLGLISPNNPICNPPKPSSSPADALSQTPATPMSLQQPPQRTPTPQQSSPAPPPPPLNPFQPAFLQQAAHAQYQAQQQQRTPTPFQRHQSGPLPSPTGKTPGSQAYGSQRQLELRPVPFQLRRWDILPDPATSQGLNDTAINLSLFGARRVG